MPSPGVGPVGAAARSPIRFVVPLRNLADETQRSARQRAGITSKSRDHHVTTAAQCIAGLQCSRRLSR